MALCIKKALGFTLIEILIALFIFALLAVITTSVLLSVLNANRQTGEHAKRLAQLQLAVSLMRQDCVQMTNQPAAKEGMLVADVLAKPGYIEFTRIIPTNPWSPGEDPGLQRIAYLWQNNTLWRYAWPALQANIARKPAARLLLSDVRRFDIHYYSYGLGSSLNWPPGNLPPAIANQVEQNPLPKAVEFTISFTHGQALDLLLIVPSSRFAAL
jgi:general secretion pathway protein J